MHHGFFFRAEDFSYFINQVETLQNDINDELDELRKEMKEYDYRMLSEGMNERLRFMKDKYGNDMHAFSHGEAYLKIFETRIRQKGIYLFDEPEAALSPIKQLSLISIILEKVKKEKAQFIIATHSPLVMGIPDACLYEIQEKEMVKVKYEDTEHYRITRSFLENPKQYLKYL
jgi:predicted ATPase